MSSPHNVGSPTSGQYYVGVWPLPFRAVVEFVFRGSLGTADPFNLRARAAFAFFGVAFGVARHIFLDDSTVARYRFAASMSSTHSVISLVADRTLNSRTGRLSILTSLSIWPLGDGKCYAAADQLLGTTGNGGSYLSRLGALLADKDRDVLIVPIAYSNTGMHDWAPGGIMFPRITRVLDQLHVASVTLTAVLWQQGENEGRLVDPDTQGYRQRFSGRGRLN